MNKTDKRKYNGGSRPGSGREKMPPEEKKQPLAFYVKKKFHDKARDMIQPIVDEINEG